MSNIGGTPDFLAIDNERFESAEPLHAKPRAKVRIAGASAIDPSREYVAPTQVGAPVPKGPITKNGTPTILLSSTQQLEVLDQSKVSGVSTGKYGPFIGATVIFADGKYEVSKTSKSVKFYVTEKRTRTLVAKLKVNAEFEVMAIQKDEKSVSLILKTDEEEVNDEEEVI